MKPQNLPNCPLNMTPHINGFINGMFRSLIGIMIRRSGPIVRSRNMIVCQVWMFLEIHSFHHPIEIVNSSGRINLVPFTFHHFYVIWISHSCDLLEEEDKKKAHVFTDKSFQIELSACYIGVWMYLLHSYWHRSPYPRLIAIIGVCLS